MELNVYTDGNACVIAVDELDAISLHDKYESSSYLNNGGTVLDWEIVPDSDVLSFLDFVNDGARVTATASDLVNDRGRGFLYTNDDLDPTW